MLKKTCRPVNATMFGSKTAFIIIGVMLLLNLAYSNAEAKSIVLYDKPIIKGVPTIIVPYGESKTIKLKNMGGSKGTLYVFAVKGKVNPYSMMPGEQKDNTTYNTSSNVLNIDFAFK
ncbi:MAG: hypothetical protein KJ882_02730 [Proteobacteria bacterium]|nr:hypothetical protein [Pseudomonadota bacterium]MBU4009658.1 hypothetical protein [Pseudomonadota bacterium]